MILVAAVAVIALLIPLTGGRLSALGAVRFRALWALWSALALQIVIVSIIPDRLPAVHAPAHLVSYGLLAVFFARNVRQPGLWLMTAGWLCNFAAIAANGGVMPASQGALTTAGIEAPAGFANSAAVTDPRLWWLGDVFALPSALPLANVFSIGDVLLVLGAAVFVFGVCGATTGRARPTGAAVHPLQPPGASARHEEAG